MVLPVFNSVSPALKSRISCSVVALLVVYGVGVAGLQSLFAGIVYFAASSLAYYFAVLTGEKVVPLWQLLASLLTLSVLAAAWVLLVSHDDWKLRSAVILAAIASYILLLKSSAMVWSLVLRENLVISESHQRQFQTVVSVFPGVCLAILGLRGFATVIPLAAALLVGGVSLHWSRKRFTIVVAALFAIVGAHLSHVWSTRSDYLFFLSFDQVFRSSLATGLTRWGWTDSNLFAGVPLRYHWLSEATAGVATRLTGIDEFVMVTRVIPVFFFTLSILILWWLLMAIGLLPWPTFAGALVVAVLAHPFDQYSIGTLYGLGLTYLVLLLVAGWASQPSNVATPVALAVVLLKLMMVQAPLGLAAIGTTGVIGVWLVIRRRVCARHAAPAAVVFIVGLWILRQTILAPSAYVDTQPTLGLDNFLQFATWDSMFGQSVESRWFARAANSLGHLSEVVVAAIPALVFIMRKSSRHSSLHATTVHVAVGLLVTSIFIVNMMDFGGSRASLGKILDLAVVVFMPISLAFLFSLSTKWALAALPIIVGVLVVANVFWFIRQSVTVGGETGIVAVPLVFVVAIALWRIMKSRPHLPLIGVVVAVVIGVGLNEQIQNAWRFGRPHVPQETVIGSPDFQRCTSWLRTSTDAESIVATNLNYLPNESPPAEKFAGVSLFSKRRVYLDAPIFMSSIDPQEAARRDDDMDSGNVPIPNVDFYLVSQTWRTDRASGVSSSLQVLYENGFCAVLGS